VWQATLRDLQRRRTVTVSLKTTCGRLTWWDGMARQGGVDAGGRARYNKGQQGPGEWHEWAGGDRHAKWAGDRTGERDARGWSVHALSPSRSGANFRRDSEVPKSSAPPGHFQRPRPRPRSSLLAPRSPPRRAASPAAAMRPAAGGPRAWTGGHGRRHYYDDDARRTRSGEQ
jgi:hypothetical protein